MKILVVLGHPQPGSFNHALADTVVEALEAYGHEVVFHDLQAEGFDPLMTGAEIASDGPVAPEIARHCEELAAAEGIVVIHPNWWGQPPAVLKGWIDRAVLPGVAYRFLEGDSGEGVPEGLLKAKTAVVLNTSNTKLERELAVFGDRWKLSGCVASLTSAASKTCAGALSRSSSRATTKSGQPGSKKPPR